MFVCIYVSIYVGRYKCPLPCECHGLKDTGIYAPMEMKSTLERTNGA